MIKIQVKKKGTCSKNHESNYKGGYSQQRLPKCAHVKCIQYLVWIYYYYYYCFGRLLTLNTIYQYVATALKLMRKTSFGREASNIGVIPLISRSYLLIQKKSLSSFLPLNKTVSDLIIQITQKKAKLYQEKNARQLIKLAISQHLKAVEKTSICREVSQIIETNTVVL